MSAVLVAVSIPIFTSQLEKSRESTDLANLRAAKAAAVTAYLGNDVDDPILSGLFAATANNSTAVNCEYNAAEGKLVAGSGGDSIGRGTAANGGCEDTKFGGYTYSNGITAQGKHISVSVRADGEVTVGFAS